MIANKCLDIEVTVVDLDADRIKAWHTGHLPIYEPGLPEVLHPARDGLPGVRKPNLFFATDIQGAVAKADLIFLCVPTPTKLTGVGSGRAADMSYVEAAARMIAEVAKDDKIVVEKSTVPCRTAEDIRKVLAAVGRPGVNFDILSNPEFLAEGTAIKDLLEPDRVLIGSLKTRRGLQAAATLADVYGRWVPHERIITMNLWSVEMAKLAANALLAQRISSINSLSAVCEATGADIDEVSYACGLDSRIGSRMLKCSVGFGGSCYKKDVLSLVYIAETHNLPEVAAYWRGVVDINEDQKERFIKRIVKCLFSTLTNKKVAILGYAYKKDTGDTRESAAISIVNRLVRENAELRIYDPKVEETQVWQSLEETNDKTAFDVIKSRVTVCRTSYEACKDADAVVIATEWDEFSNKTSNRTPTPTPQPPILDSSNNFQIPPRKRSAGLVIRNPDTGNVVTFDKISPHAGPPGKPQSPFNGFSTTSQKLYEGSDSGNYTTSRSSRSSIVDTSTGSPVTNTNLTSPLTDASHDPMHGPSVTYCSDEGATALSDEVGTSTLGSPGAYRPDIANFAKQAISIPSNTHTAKQNNPKITVRGELDKIEKLKKQGEAREKMDWSLVAQVMRRPMFVFDGRNIVDAEKLRQLGFWVEGIGKPGVGGLT